MRDTVSQRAALRARIIEHMDAILDIVKPEDRLYSYGAFGDEERDYRPRIVINILEIADFKGEPPPSSHRKVELAAKKLRAAIRSVSEYYWDVERMLDKTIAASQRRATRGPNVRINWGRRLLAARHAYDLMYFNPSRPSLSNDG